MKQNRHDALRAKFGSAGKAVAEQFLRTAGAHVANGEIIRPRDWNMAVLNYEDIEDAQEFLVRLCGYRAV